MDLQLRHQDQELHLVFQITKETLIIIKGGSYLTEKYKVSIYISIELYSFCQLSLHVGFCCRLKILDKLVVRDIANNFM